MARLKDEKTYKRACKLFSKGMTPPQVAQQLGVHTTTAYRWKNEYDATSLENLENVGNVGNVGNVERMTPTTIEKSATVPMGVLDTTASRDKGVLDTMASRDKLSKLWLKMVEDMLIEHKALHRKIAGLLGQKLISELEKPDTAYRHLNFMSIALTRHLDAEQKCLFGGRQDMIELARAFMVMHAYGYTPLDEEHFNMILKEIDGDEQN